MFYNLETWSPSRSELHPAIRHKKVDIHVDENTVHDKLQFATNLFRYNNKFLCLKEPLPNETVLLPIHFSGNVN